MVEGLAESYDISEDGSQVTFTLRAGVQFHSNGLFTPTRPLNANDVIFSFERQLGPENPYYGYAGNWDTPTTACRCPT